MRVREERKEMILMNKKRVTREIKMNTIMERETSQLLDNINEKSNNSKTRQLFPLRTHSALLRSLKTSLVNS